MDITKTRKQGNAIVVTVPAKFHIKENTPVRPKLTKSGILYEFVNEDDDFFDFDTDILRDLVDQGLTGNELVQKFSEVKKSIPYTLDLLYDEAKKNKPMSKEEAMKEFDL